MTKKFRPVKASILTGIILVSVIVAMLPTASAGPLFNLQSVLTVNWGNETQQPVVPRGALRQLDIEISHTVTHGVLGKYLLQLYTSTQVIIDLEITDKSPWVTATLSQSSLQAVLTPGETIIVKTKLSLQVSDDAPAFQLGYVTIKATAQPIALIKGYTKEFTLNFVADYKPLIKPSLPNTNAKTIGPMDTAVFPINIENLGNARTIVYLSVVNTSLPKDWVAIVTDQVTLEEGSGSTGTAYLVIKPPKGFGYHDEKGTISVSLQPVQADNQANKGEIVYQTVLVESRGFSTPGFEAIGFIGALAIVMITIFIIRKRK
jgi:hypothetical protein